MTKEQKNLRLTLTLAMLTAISIILGKYLAIRGGDVMRFSLENMPIIFAGMAFGPLAGGLVGCVSDLVGCVMVGYTINPTVTIGAAVIGVISGLVPHLLKKCSLDERLVTVITVAFSHLLGSLIIKTLGLAAYYDMPFLVLLLWRALNYVIVGVLDGLTVHILLHNKGIKMQINALREDGK